MNRAYCPRKFDYAFVNLYEASIAVCCHATPEVVPVEWMQSNPGQLFNTNLLKNERTSMLNGVRVDSCESCYSIEDKGAASTRTKLLASDYTAYSETTAKPRILDIMIGNQCGMSCVYCFKGFSSRWQDDLVRNGSYSINDRNYHVEPRDQILAKLTPEKKRSGSKYLTALAEVKTLIHDELEQVCIIGGEPLMDQTFEDMVDMIPSHVRIKVTTGLGVKPSHLKRFLDKLKGKNMFFLVSAEATGQYYELLRYGNTWEQFKQNLQMIRDYGFDFKVRSTLSNLSLLDYTNFLDYIGEVEIITQLVTTPSFQSPHVLDESTKDLIRTTTDDPDILAAIALEPTDAELDKFKTFLSEFANRRSIDLGFLPFKI